MPTSLYSSNSSDTILLLQLQGFVCTGYAHTKTVYDVFCCKHFTGTTWTQEMVWCIANDLDYEGAKLRLPERFPFLE